MGFGNINHHNNIEYNPAAGMEIALVDPAVTYQRLYERNCTQQGIDEQWDELLPSLAGTDTDNERSIAIANFLGPVYWQHLPNVVHGLREKWQASNFKYSYAPNIFDMISDSSLDVINAAEDGAELEALAFVLQQRHQFATEFNNTYAKFDSDREFLDDLRAIDIVNNSPTFSREDLADAADSFTKAAELANNFGGYGFNEAAVHDSLLKLSQIGVNGASLAIVSAYQSNRLPAKLAEDIKLVHKWYTSMQKYFATPTSATDYATFGLPDYEYCRESFDLNYPHNVRVNIGILRTINSRFAENLMLAASGGNYQMDSQLRRDNSWVDYFRKIAWQTLDHLSDGTISEDAQISQPEEN